MRIAIGQVEVADPYAVHVGFQIAGLFTLPFFRAVDAEAALYFLGLYTVGQNGHAVEALLAMPDGFVTDRLEFVRGEAFVHRLDFLQAGDGRTGFLKPFLETRQAGLDTVDVEAGDTHGGPDARNASAGLI